MSAVSKYEETRLSNINALLNEYHRTFGQSEANIVQQTQEDEYTVISKKRCSYSKKLRFGPTRRSARIRTKTSDICNDDAIDEYLDEDYISKEPILKKRNFTPRIILRNVEQREILKPEDVTNEDIAAICYKSSGKKYDPHGGTTCHQCRQKTKDTKSVCRNAECSGVRGQFCGFCLKNRYGEDVATVLKDPEWSCPPCRGICNCSICRTREGKVPTGILAPYVKSDGCSNVKEYLEKHEDRET